MASINSKDPNLFSNRISAHSKGNATDNQATKKEVQTYYDDQKKLGLNGSQIKDLRTILDNFDKTDKAGTAQSASSNPDVNAASAQHELLQRGGKPSPGSANAQNDPLSNRPSGQDSRDLSGVGDGILNQEELNIAAQKPELNKAHVGNAGNASKP